MKPIFWISVVIAMSATSGQVHAAASALLGPSEQQLTRGPGGRILTNIGVWSPDGKWIVYDVRSDAAGEKFDGARIEMANVETGEVRVLYQSEKGAFCGAVTFNPHSDRVAFIMGPENPTSDWSYSASHRHGVIVALAHPGVIRNLDARDLTPPFTPGALRGGSHLHVWDANGEWISFTYHDAILESHLRDVGVSVPQPHVQARGKHPRNHDAQGFSVIVTRTTPNPDPGSDDIQRACEEAWVGNNGYLRADGSRQPHALAFQGTVVSKSGASHPEVFVVDLPADLTLPGDGPVAGTSTRRPSPPGGVKQRRLTFTSDRKYPGLQGPRHWLRSSPDGSRIAFLMKDDAGIVQLWTVSPNGGQPLQLTHDPWPIASAFTWSPDGRHLAHVVDNSIAVTDSRTGQTARLTPRSDDSSSPRPEACVFSPDGKRIAYIRRLPVGSIGLQNHIMVLAWK